MTKRKRELEPLQTKSVPPGVAASKISRTNGHIDVKTSGPTLQIVVGTYERILHGFTASISTLEPAKANVDIADSFLFNAHESQIRCVAISPPSLEEASGSSDVYLATGGSDEKINVYNLSVSAISESDKLPSMPPLGSNKISENPGNRELGTLMQHTSNITALHFPTRSKLISASEDNTITVARTRDLTVVSSIKAPRPKVQGQPSGDTAPPGATPAGINDFAVHPSMKLMITVGRGERSMRLWNLVTGKKAGVLNFDRSILQLIKESKYSSGEGRKIRWNPSGTEFAVSFERGVIIYGEDSKPRSVVLPQPLTKVHQLAYTQLNEDEIILSVSTEDGRVIFYNTAENASVASTSVPTLSAICQVGGRTASSGIRVKDFKLLSLMPKDGVQDLIMVTASSDGCVRLWHIRPSDMRRETTKTYQPIQVGTLIGTYETGNRITCLDAFLMLPPEDTGNTYSEFEGISTEAEDESLSDSSDSE